MPRFNALTTALSVGLFVSSLLIKDVNIIASLVVCAVATGLLYQGLTK